MRCDEMNLALFALTFLTLLIVVILGFWGPVLVGNISPALRSDFVVENATYGKDTLHYVVERLDAEDFRATDEKEPRKMVDPFPRITNDTSVACRHFDLPALDPIAMKFYSDLPPLKCDQSKHWITVKGTRLQNIIADGTWVDKKFTEEYLSGFLLRQFQKNGYATAYLEDEQNWGTYHSFLSPGYRNSPADHYTRMYMWLRGRLNGYKESCCGPRSCNWVAQTYFQYLWDLHKDVPKFFFGLQGSYSHSVSPDTLGFIDGEFESFLHWIKTNLSNDTLVIIMGDHGHRFHEFGGTRQGMLEMRMPLMHISFPEWFERQFPDAVNNLRTNSKRLATPMDLHVTLKSLLNFRALDFKTGPSVNDSLPVALNWFLPVPKERTCEMAEVAVHWCACPVSKPLETSSPIALQMSSALVVFINKQVNKILESFKRRTEGLRVPECQKWTLKSVQHATELQGGAEDLHEITSSGLHNAFGTLGEESFNCDHFMMEAEFMVFLAILSIVKSDTADNIEDWNEEVISGRYGNQSAHQDAHLRTSMIYLHSRFSDRVRTSLEESLDDFFITTLGIVIVLMQAGFAFLEAGSVRSKNTVNILMKNLLNFLIGGLSYWFVGYVFAFGDGNAFFGWSNWPVLNTDYHDVQLCWIDFLHAATASSIASGAVAGRCRASAYFVFATCLPGIIYPVAKHWTWHPEGWLRKSPYKSYAGAGTVHLLGGVVALVGTTFLGPRIGMFDENTGKPTNEIRGHSVPWVAFGGFIVLFGTMAFAAGFQGHITQPGDGDVIALSIVNTLLGGCFGGLGCLFFKRYIEKSSSWSFLMTQNGCLAGMVAVTAGCNVYAPWFAGICGFLGGCIYLSSHFMFLRFGVDDPVESIPTHLGPSILGLLVVGLFMDRGFGRVLQWNCIAVLAIGGWAFVTAGLMFGILKWLKILRIAEYKEKGGLDHWNHKEPAYPIVSWLEGEMPETHASAFIKNCTVMMDSYAQVTPRISAENLPAMVILDAVSRLADIPPEETLQIRPRASSVPAVPVSRFLADRRAARAKSREEGDAQRSQLQTIISRNNTAADLDDY
ncbi:unnamed protein product [Notodromas monacha]|uniref:Ammonium transporter AmtB-like domain-containing protein n=1 Tax=Notodromas monacha TaxID=399045 RepID=A0A7R9BHG6_9CRUS|nr:unnamed protein product [Notodromas monacha]CAG0915571.1 unnamed protein product [Notodromas monacha]